MTLDYAMMSAMGAGRKRRAWRQGVIVAVVILVLLVCVVPLVWIVPVFEDDGSGPRDVPGIATPMSLDEQTPTP